VATHPHLGDFLGFTPTSDLNLAEVVERGLPLDSLRVLRERGLTATEIAEIVISPRTLKHRKARKEPLSQGETDRAVRVARIVAMAREVFGDPGKALLWLRSPDDRLANRTPLNMLHTESGGRVIESMLWQLDEGVYS
jgi:putative toxin-antitoxin system antitoxin component (TIGR02293 family)